MIMTMEELENTPSYRCKDKILPLIQVLDDLYGITFFWFMRMDKKLGTFTAGNSLDFGFKYWNEYASVKTNFWNQYFNGIDVKIYDATRTSASRAEYQMFEDRLQNYRLSDQGIIIVNTCDQYIDTFNFSSIKFHDDAINILLNNILNLKMYCDFFVSEIDSLLRDPSNYKTIHINVYSRLSSHTAQETGSGNIDRHKAVYANPYTNKFIKERILSTINLTLTPMESKCLYWAMRGKTAAQTAEILNKSARTIEGHLLEIRVKFGCNKISAVLLKAEKLGFIRNGEVFTQPTLM